MKRLIFWFLVILALLIALQIIVGRIVKARFRPALEDRRWKEALAAYRSAREHGAPQAEIETRKRELGRIFRELQAEHGH